MRSILEVFTAILALGTVIVGCASEPEEPIATSQSSLERSCIEGLPGSAGTKAWRDAFMKCLNVESPSRFDDEPKIDAPTPPKADTPQVAPPAPPEAPAAPRNGTRAPTTPKAPPEPERDGRCGLSIACRDGVCQCMSGPNAGASCIGSTSTGAKSCSQLCKVCD